MRAVAGPAVSGMVATARDLSFRVRPEGQVRTIPPTSHRAITRDHGGKLGKVASR